jgi:tripartite-type tricarboxylate transporter receptor subunit TctC
MKALLHCCAALAMILGGGNTALAEAYPSKPIRMVSPFPAGGGNDVLARIVAARMSETMGQTVIVENVTGASGNIAASQVLRSAPDGYTLLFPNNTIVTNPAIGTVPFDVLKDFAPVGVVGTTAVVVAVHPDLPVKTMGQLVELLARNPNKYSFSSCGSGTTMHLAGELLKQAAKVSMVHVPYKGCAPAITDGVGGHVPILFNTYTSVRPHADQGKLRILAVASRTRSAFAPDVPTVGEGNPALRGVVADIWSGVLAPAATPAAVLAKLNTELNAALQSPDTKKKLEATYTEVRPTTPAEMSELMREELARWTQLVKDVGLVVQQ